MRYEIDGYKVNVLCIVDKDHQNSKIVVDYNIKVEWFSQWQTHSLCAIKPKMEQHV